MWQRLAKLLKALWYALVHPRKAAEERAKKREEEAARFPDEWATALKARKKQRETAFSEETQRVELRRKELGLHEVKDRGKWGLALSGGGIRSATVGLGVLQSLALSASPLPPKEPPPKDASAPNHELLREFDYVSSVSGGGYIAGFFISLFVPGRLIQGSTALQAAVDAYKVLRHEPPGRIRSNEDYRTPPEPPGKGPLAWLRENGRYLAPTGGGDLMYAAALAIRNWFSVQYVLGTLLIGVLSLLAVVRTWMAVQVAGYYSMEKNLLVPALSGAWWWSPIWMLPLAFLILWMAPFATGFWLTHAARGESDAAKPRYFPLAARCSLGLGVVLAAAARQADLRYLADWPRLPMLLILLSTIALGGFAAHCSTVTASRTISEQRVKMTRLLTSGLQGLLLTALIALADTLGQHLYLMATTEQNLWKSLTPGALIAALVWALRRLAGFFDEKETGWIKKIPLGLIAGLVGGALLLLIITLWAVFVQWLQWRGLTPDAALLSSPLRAWIVTVVFVLFLVLSYFSGMFPGFLNLSTLQTLYGARLTRAYLGGSNGERFKPSADPAVRSAAEPHPKDQLSHESYYNWTPSPGQPLQPTLAPVHLINVTLNQTLDPAEQLVQRDRKGKPLAVTPQGFTIDGEPYLLKDDRTETINSGKGSQKYSIGQWIGISGAAFTTGLGRSTSLGVSLALGLANVRLGMWWSSGYGVDRSKGWGRAFKNLFRTQTFLIYELFAMFHGMRREWQYLSDGGHYENTAVYELLRADREIRLIVVCDNGCDPLYHFGDLANLIRLARIDYRLEISVDAEVAKEPKLKRYFGVPADFTAVEEGTKKCGCKDGGDRPEEPSPEKCALLLNVVDRNPGATFGKIVCRIVLLKPRLLPTMPSDVREYQKTHPAFPQEPTADQFFDEAQWESYRSVGFHIGRRIFGAGPDEVGPALWEYLYQRHA